MFIKASRQSLFSIQCDNFWIKTFDSAHSPIKMLSRICTDSGIKTNLSMIHGFTTTATSQTTRAFLPRSSYPDSLWPRLAPRSAHSGLSVWKVLLSSIILSSCPFFSSQLSSLSFQGLTTLARSVSLIHTLRVSLSFCHTIIHIWSFSDLPCDYQCIFLPHQSTHTQYFHAHRARVQLVHHYTQHQSGTPKTFLSPCWMNEWEPPQLLKHTVLICAAHLRPEHVPCFLLLGLRPSPQKEAAVAVMVHRCRICARCKVMSRNSYGLGRRETSESPKTLCC